MLEGIVKWFNERKGLGVIVPAEDHTASVVVMASRVADPTRVLRQGEAVAYELDPDRPHIVRLVVVNR